MIDSNKELLLPLYKNKARSERVEVYREGLAEKGRQPQRKAPR